MPCYFIVLLSCIIKPRLCITFASDAGNNSKHLPAYRVAQRSCFHRCFSAYFDLEVDTFLANEALGISKLLTWETNACSVLGRISSRYNIAYSTVVNWRDQVASGKWQKN